MFNLIQDKLQSFPIFSVLNRPDLRPTTHEISSNYLSLSRQDDYQIKIWQFLLSAGRKVNIGSEAADVIILPVMKSPKTEYVRTILIIRYLAQSGYRVKVISLTDRKKICKNSIPYF